jgi:hypothetical protein
MDAGSNHEKGKASHQHDDPDDDNAGQLEEQFVGPVMLGIVHCRMAFGRIDAHSTPLLTLGLLLCRANYHKAHRPGNPARMTGRGFAATSAFDSSDTRRTFGWPRSEVCRKADVPTECPLT